MTNKITMIKASQLEHHPDNPRKNIGDITELTASIQKDGILQNLTVVPKPDEKNKYLVVIGNRRLEAAKAAGLTELPCVISDMDHTKQIETMLVENINRSDLTIAEEAEGFKQLTLAGFSVDDIAEKTGFSKSTINRRLKIAEYSTKKVDEALERGATLADFVKLEKLKDEKDREALLEDIGTNNFNQSFNRLLVEQTEKENKLLFKTLLKGKAKYISEKELGDTWSAQCKYERDRQNNPDISLRRPYTKDDIEVKGDYEHFYCFRYGDCEFFKLKHKKEKATKDKPAHTEMQKQYERNRRKLNNMAVEFYNLRKEFVKSLNSKKTLPGWKDICLDFIASYAIENYNFNIGIDWNFNNDSGIIGTHKERDTKRKDYIEAHKAGFIINQIYKGFCDSSSYDWHYSEQYEHPKYTGCDSLDMLYEFICKFGYQMCDDEIKCQNGTHELMKKVK